VHFCAIPVFLPVLQNIPDLKVWFETYGFQFEFQRIVKKRGP
jgi:hypothetical protein